MSGKRRLKVLYGNSNIQFRLIQSKRKTLEISVLPDMSVEVKAPLKAAMTEIKARVQKRGSWIIKKQHYFETFLPEQPERKYTAGETHRYLGRQYRLKLKRSNEKSVKLIHGFLLVSTPDPKDKDQVKIVVQSWFRKRAKEHLEKRFQQCLSNNRLRLKSSPELKVRSMKSRWGSCSNDGKIVLNPKLIHVSSSCIDYVIFHELCHLIEHNHSKKFYRLLERELPNWKKLQQKLNSPH